MIYSVFNWWVYMHIIQCYNRINTNKNDYSFYIFSCFHMKSCHFINEDEVVRWSIKVHILMSLYFLFTPFSINEIPCMCIGANVRVFMGYHSFYWHIIQIIIIYQQIAWLWNEKPEEIACRKKTESNLYQTFFFYCTGLMQ